MHPMIFTTCSYAICFDLESGRTRELELEYRKFGIRVLVVKDRLDLGDILHKVRYLVAIHMKASNIEPLEDLIGESTQWIVNESLGQMELVDVLKKLVPIGLETICSNAAHRVALGMHHETSLGFVESSAELPRDFDFLIHCDTLAYPHIGRCLLFVRSSLFVQNYPELSQMSRKLLIDSLKEFVNQFLGWIHQGLAQTGVSSRLGVPVIYHRDDVEFLTRGGLYMPYVGLADHHKALEIRFAWVNSQAGKRIELQSWVHDGTIGSIDYL
jgi:hypothetical protein